MFNRATRLQPPPVFVRSNEKLFYGTGLPAPWNNTSHKSQPSLSSATGKKAKDVVANGKNSEPKVTGTSDKGEVVDAMLYATWDWDRKNYRVSLPPGKKSRQSFSLPPGPGSRPSFSTPIINSSTGKIKGSGKMDANKG